MNKLNNLVELGGFFTTQLWVQGKTLREIERLMGFDNGRLSQGAWFATVAFRLPKPEEFEFAGYSHVAGHRTTKVYGNLNSPQTQNEKDYYAKQKETIIRTKWSMQGSSRLIKVVPMIGHSIFMGDDFQYPPGAGIPQWKLVKKLYWKGISFVKEYSEERFIPEQGFTNVKYR